MNKRFATILLLCFAAILLSLIYARARSMQKIENSVGKAVVGFPDNHRIILSQSATDNLRRIIAKNPKVYRPGKEGEPPLASFELDGKGYYWQPNSLFLWDKETKTLSVWEDPLIEKITLLLSQDKYRGTPRFEKQLISVLDAGK